MQQYFIETKISNRIDFNDEQAHHIKNVMRMKENTIVKVVDPDEKAAYVSIHYEGKNTYGLFHEAIEESNIRKIKISLAVSLIKKEKWDYCIQKSCECGAYEILPFTSSRSVVKVNEEKNDKKLSRWQKIALEACEQSKQNHCCVIEPVSSFKEILQHPSNLKCIAYENADCHSDSLGKVLSEHPDISSIMMMVGPEGGFSEEEVELAKKEGFIPVSLGHRILRAETACVAAINMITYHYEMLGEEYGTFKKNTEK